MQLKVGILSTFVCLIVMLQIPMPVAATFSGSDTPSYSDDGTDSYRDFATRTSDDFDGECEIKVVYLSWPWYYAASTQDVAWVGAAYEMDCDVTNNWYFKGEWHIDYEIGAAYDCKIYIEIWFQVRDSSGNLLQEFRAWYDVVESYTWEYSSSDGDEQDDKTLLFSRDLDDDTWYKFCVALKVWVYYAGRDYKCHADTNSNNPATLTVDKISWWV